MKTQKIISYPQQAFTYLSYVFIIAVLFFISWKAEAQEIPYIEASTPIVRASPHKVKFGYGLGSSVKLIPRYSRILLEKSNKIGICEKNKTTTDVFFGSYEYIFRNRLTVGSSANSEQFNSDAYLKNKRYGSFIKHFVTLAVEVDYHYIDKRYFTMYSGLGLGITSLYERFKTMDGTEKINSHCMWNFQVTAVGFHIGNKFGAFAEFGFGYRGMINMGLFGHFIL